jgi:hypothetical protein
MDVKKSQLLSITGYIRVPSGYRPAHSRRDDSTEQRCQYFRAVHAKLIIFDARNFLNITNRELIIIRLINEKEAANHFLDHKGKEYFLCTYNRALV